MHKVTIHFQSIEKKKQQSNQTVWKIVRSPQLEFFSFGFASDVDLHVV